MKIHEFIAATSEIIENLNKARQTVELGTPNREAFTHIDNAWAALNDIHHRLDEGEEITLN